MEIHDSILVVLVIVMAAVVACQARRPAAGQSEGYRPARFIDRAANPYSILNMSLDSDRGNPDINAESQITAPDERQAAARRANRIRAGMRRASPMAKGARRPVRYGRAGVSASPEQISEAERQSWFQALGAAEARAANADLAHSTSAGAGQYHTPAPALDYGMMITDLVADERTRDNHKKWATEMAPWSGTAMKVDDLEMENYLDFQGLRRPQAIVVYNPTQLTEIGPSDLARNNKFNFQG